MRKTHEEIIRGYKRWKRKNPDPWIVNCKAQGNIIDAIDVAALSKNKNGEKHSHQYRLEKSNMEAFKQNLISVQRQLVSVNDFDSLLQIVSNARTTGIGALAVYDTAVRLGSYLNKEPDKIFLHAGTRIGAGKLLKKTIKKPSITKTELPAPFKDSDLSCYELEDLLCIYKNEL